MKVKQTVEWIKFSEKKPDNNDWVMFFVKGKNVEGAEDLVFFFGQFRYPYMTEPDVYKEDYMYFAVPNDKRIFADENTEWISLNGMADEVHKHYAKDILDKKE